MPKYNSNAIRRCVRQTAEIDGTHAFVTKSFTNHEAEWHPVVEVQPNGGIRYECDCPDWRYRRSRTNAPCKHITRALSQLERKDVL